MTNIREIAAASGFAKSTVSLALREDPSIPAATRAKIRREAKRLGYVANATVARLMCELRKGRKLGHRANLALINACRVPDAFARWHTYSLWREGFRARAGQLGYGVEEFWLGEPGLSPARLASILYHRGVAGVAFAIEQGRLPSAARPLWTRFPCVVLGSAPTRPALHFASSDQFAAARLAAERLFALGYRRPGLVAFREVEDIVGRRFSAGLYAAWQQLAPEAPPPPVLLVEGDDLGALAAWLERHRPDAILSLVPRVREWCAARGLAVPARLGLAYLDLGPYVAGWSGMDQNNRAVGEGAAGLVIGLAQRGETGLPASPAGLLVEGRWVAGETTRATRPGRKATSQGLRKR